jgi:hypothetical protein
LSLTSLDERVVPAGTVAVYDNADNGYDNDPNNTASAAHFTSAANDFVHRFGSHDWSQIITQLTQYVTQNGTSALSVVSLST